MRLFELGLEIVEVFFEDVRRMLQTLKNFGTLCLLVLWRDLQLAARLLCVCYLCGVRNRVHGLGLGLEFRVF